MTRPMSPNVQINALECIVKTMYYMINIEQTQINTHSKHNHNRTLSRVSRSLKTRFQVPCALCCRVPRNRTFQVITRTRTHSSCDTQNTTVKMHTHDFTCFVCVCCVSTFCCGGSVGAVWRASLCYAAVLCART